MMIDTMVISRPSEPNAQKLCSAMTSGVTNSVINTAASGAKALRFSVPSKHNVIAYTANPTTIPQVQIIPQ